MRLKFALVLGVFVLIFVSLGVVSAETYIWKEVKTIVAFNPDGAGGPNLNGTVACKNTNNNAYRANWTGDRCNIKTSIPTGNYPECKGVKFAVVGEHADCVDNQPRDCNYKYSDGRHSRPVLVVNCYTGTLLSKNCIGGVVGYWTLDNDDILGKEVYDLFREHDGINDDAIPGYSGVVNEAFKFDGGNGIDLPTGTHFSTHIPINNWSISAWFKASSISSSDCGSKVIAFLKEDDSLGSKVSLALGKNKAQVCYKNSSGVSKIINVAPVSLNTWYFFTVTYNGTDYNAYINGELKNTTRDSFYGFDGGIDQTGIGYHARGGDRRFYGLIDEVAIFNKSLNDTEIFQIYQNAVRGFGYCEEAPVPPTPGQPTHLCPNNDRIMKLFSPSNSHGAFWNFSAYSWDICYSDIFGRDYPIVAGENPHICNGGGAIPTNKVLGLYQENNSHAEVPILDNYNFDVCYGDLQCINVTATTCPADYKTVVRLAQNNNSHISNASDTNYPIKICCKSQDVLIPPTTITGAYFKNMEDVPINKSDLNDLVKLVVGGEGIQNKKINYTIYKSIAWWFDEKVAQSSGTGFTTWRAGLKGDGTLEDGTYYFKAKVIGESGEIDTRDNGNLNLRYLQVVSPENNAKPNIIIDYPAKSMPIAERRFKINKNIDFNQTAYDVDDDLEITWKFGDTGTRTCIKSREECDVKHAYSMWGTKEVDLTAKEIGRTGSDDDSTQVFIYNESINVFALITEPNHSGSIPPAFRSAVKFNANESWVANCTTDATALCGPHGETCYGVDGLNCYDFNKTGEYGIGTTSGKQYDLWFNWTFDELGTDGGERLGDWISNYSYAVEFNRTFFTPTYHWAKLKAGYDPK